MLAAEYGTTLSVVILAAYALQLHSGNEETSGICLVPMSGEQASSLTLPAFCCSCCSVFLLLCSCPVSVTFGSHRCVLPLRLQELLANFAPFFLIVAVTALVLGAAKLAGRLNVDDEDTARKRLARRIVLGFFKLFISAYSSLVKATFTVLQCQTVSLPEGDRSVNFITSFNAVAQFCVLFT